IGDYAFQNCSGLTRIIIPNSVSAIGNAAFSGCDSLELVKVSWNVAVNIDTSVFTVTTYSKAELYINENFPSYLETNWSLFDNIFVAGHPTKRYSDGVLSYRVIEDPNNREAIVVAGDYSSLSEVFIPERFTDDSNPSEPVRYYVTCIGAGAFKNCRNLKSIMFNDRINLTAICDEAFCGCSGLSEMTIPNSVTSIGNSAFRDCSSLSEVIIPNSVTTIGNSAFYGCSRMSSVNISESVTYIGEDAFYNCKSLKNFDFASIESLCKIQFANINSNPTINARWTCEYYPTRFDANILGNIHINGEDISDLAIPETISSIGNYTFVRFPIRSVTISNSVTTVGNSAFEGCYSLSSVTIPNSVFSIGNSAFSTCISLTSVTIPNSVKSIGNTAFSSCGSLREVSLLEGDEIDFGDEVFQEGRNLELGPIQWQTPNINKIFLGRPLSKQVFNLSYLETLTIGNSVTEIGMSIWQGATELTNLTLGNSLTTIGDDAFSGCNSLREVVVPPSVENIGASAFAGTPLSSIIMGHNVKEIGEKAFDGCPASTVSITAPTPPTAPNNTFSNYTGKLYVQGQDAIEAYYNAYTCWDRFNSYALIEPTEMKHEGSLSYKAEPGEQIQLSATLMPEGVSLPQVFWRSTNPAVATVNHNGLVTVAADLSGVESGAKNCKIIAESLYADGPVIEFSIDTENDEIEVNGISLDRTEAMMTEGQTLKLIATVTPENATDKALDWATSDAGVTTVDQTGTVTAQHAGTATITATTANGLEAVCEVTVVAKVVEPTDITLNLTTAKIIEGETVQLTASVAPADVTDATVTWTSSDETVATVDQTGLVSGVKMGPATITATTANGLTAQCVVTVDEMTGLYGVDGADISVAVSDHLIVVTAPEDTEVEVYAINGMRVVVTHEHRIEILADGVYLVRVADRVFKVVVK
ncbi:MAG: leucine-rich repeat protein, partial [Bacteroidales bacterium]|nr:leucine-rich repeat protein [Bacteroidales bacterium]